jgi:hypothetical protein
MTLTEIAKEIGEYLKRFESDKTINKINKRFHTSEYYHAHAYRGGRYVRVTYVSYQGASSLTKEEALKYLEWLRAGNVGRHWDMIREAKV